MLEIRFVFITRTNQSYIENLNLIESENIFAHQQIFLNESRAFSFPYVLLLLFFLFVICILHFTQNIQKRKMIKQKKILFEKFGSRFCFSSIFLFFREVVRLPKLMYNVRRISYFYYCMINICSFKSKYTLRKFNDDHNGAWYFVIFMIILLFYSYFFVCAFIFSFLEKRFTDLTLHTIVCCLPTTQSVQKRKARLITVHYSTTLIDENSCA